MAKLRKNNQALIEVMEFRLGELQHVLRRVPYPDLPRRAAAAYGVSMASRLGRPTRYLGVLG